MRRANGGAAHDGPQRTCVGCRAKRSQDALTRIAKRPDGDLAVGRTLAGRGAWLCAGSLDCFDRAVRTGALHRALRVPRSVATEQLRTRFVRDSPAARD